MYAGSAAEVEVSQEQGEFVILQTIIEENGECDVVTADRDSKVWEKMTSSLLTGIPRYRRQ
jgi:hypothetical protein